MAQNGKRGFAKMDPQKQREIASKGGKAAHQKGRAHEFTPEEARVAGRKGGLASHQRHKAAAPTADEARQETRPEDQPPRPPEYHPGTNGTNGVADVTRPPDHDQETRQAFAAYVAEEVEASRH